MEQVKAVHTGVPCHSDDLHFVGRLAEILFLHASRYLLALIRFLFSRDQRIMPSSTNTRARAVRHDGWTPARKQPFFETLAAGYTVSRTCARGGLPRQAAYNARRRDPAFAQAWRFALETPRRTAFGALLERRPEYLRRPLSGSSTPCELRGARIPAQDTVNPGNILSTWDWVSASLAHLESGLI